MELTAAALAREGNPTLGDLAEQWGEPAARIGDAIDALKVMRGEPSYIGAGPTARELAAADEMTALTEDLGLYDQG